MPSSGPVLFLLDIRGDSVLEWLQLLVELFWRYSVLRVTHQPGRRLHRSAPGSLLRIGSVPGSWAARRFGSGDLVQVGVLVLAAALLVILDADKLVLKGLGLLADLLAEGCVLVAVRVTSDVTDVTSRSLGCADLRESHYFSTSAR